MKIPKQAYATKFKELAVKQGKDGQSISTVIKDRAAVAGRDINLTAAEVSNTAKYGTSTEIGTTLKSRGVQIRCGNQNPP